MRAAIFSTRHIIIFVYKTPAYSPLVVGAYSIDTVSDLKVDDVIIFIVFMLCLHLRGIVSAYICSYKRLFRFTIPIYFCFC